MLDNGNVFTEKNSMCDFLRTVRTGFPPELLTGEYFTRLETLLVALPPAYGHIYEFWLSDGTPRVDFQCYFRHGEGLSLADRVPSDSPVWSSVKDLMRNWRDRGPDLYDGVWLEFDLGSGGSENNPRVGFAFNEMRGGLAGGAADVFDKYIDIFRLTAERLPGGGVTADTEDIMRRCFEAFPDDSSLYGTGFSYVDGGLAVRWCVTFRDWRDIPGFLHRIGWRGNTDRLASDMPRWADTGHVALALDFFNDILPTVGLEYYLRQTVWENPHIWDDCLDDIVQMGLMHPRWPSLLVGIRRIFHREENPDAWPPCLAAMSDLTGREALLALNLAHVKLLFDGNSFTHAKSYMYSTYHFQEPQ